MRARSDQQGTIRGPDRVGYTVRSQAAVNSHGVYNEPKLFQDALTSQSQVSSMYPTLDRRRNMSFSSDISPLHDA